MKARERVLTVVCLVLVFFAVQALASGSLAVSAESESVLPLGSEGNSNTFYGSGAGNSTAGDDDDDTFIGYQAGYSNTTGFANSFLGYQAGYSNTAGYCNTFVGHWAGYSNAAASYNSFLGYQAGDHNTTGAVNSFLGYQAGYSNTTGEANTFIGASAGRDNTTGGANTFIGRWAGSSNTTGGLNSFLGYQSGSSNTTGSSNTFLGFQAGSSNTTGGLNSFLGYEAGYSNTTGHSNTFVGINAGYSNIAGYSNTFVGINAGYSNNDGNSNTLLGRGAGYLNTSGLGNVFLGYSAGSNETGSNRLYIDNSNTSSPLIYGEFDTNKLTINGNLEVIGPDNGLVRLSDVTTDNTTKASRMVLRHYSNSQLPVYLFGAASTASANFVAFGGGSTIGNAATQIDLFTAPNTTTAVGTPRLTIIGNGYVGIGTQTPSQPLQMAGGAYTNGTQWINASSREYKENIESLNSREALMTLVSLEPVKFNYKSDASEKHVGFIAEDVPGLVATKDRKGLSPMDIVAVLTKVVQEQQKVVQEQEKMFTEKKREYEERISQLEQRLLALEGKVVAGK